MRNCLFLFKAKFRETTSLFRKMYYFIAVLPEQEKNIKKEYKLRVLSTGIRAFEK
jgi:hypothetical protein